MENTEKTIFKRLQEVKYKLSTTKLAKTGKNSHLSYNYFELSDFLPTLINLCNEAGVYTQVSFNNELATLTAINVDNPNDRVEVTSPLREADLKGATPVQNLGAQQTYLRRYLYMSMFDIVDNDVCDSVQGREDMTRPNTNINYCANNAVSAQKVPNQGFKPATDAQLGYAKRLGMKVEPNKQYSYQEVNEFIKSHNNTPKQYPYQQTVVRQDEEDEADMIANNIG